jgi:ubiquinone biosynthesis protein COQ4
MAGRACDSTGSARRDWPAAFRALRRLLADSDDTVQVFRITNALNGRAWQRNYRRLISTTEGGRVAYRRVELARRLRDRAWVESFPEGSVAAGYRAFLETTGYSADGLIEVSVAIGDYPAEVEHPYAWFRRRERDLHDLWHVLTGYRADDPLGEACLVAFSYGQTTGLGWGLIGAGAALRSLRTTADLAFARAVWEAYRHGRRAAWLHGEDYEALMGEPMESARRRLGIAEPKRYREARARLDAAGMRGL